MTSPKMPLSSADEMVYAITGWPARGLMFLFLTRFEPARAGIRPTMPGVRSRGMGLPLWRRSVPTRGDRSQNTGVRRFTPPVFCLLTSPLPDRDAAVHLEVLARHVR